MMRSLVTLAAIFFSVSPALAQSPALRPDQAAYGALYQELVETDTSITTGNCTVLAEKIAGHLRQAG